jgi:hypothetical protein
MVWMVFGHAGHPGPGPGPNEAIQAKEAIQKLAMARIDLIELI